jgi:hypothetical protein
MWKCQGLTSNLLPGSYITVHLKGVDIVEKRETAPQLEQAPDQIQIKRSDLRAVEPNICTTAAFHCKPSFLFWSSHNATFSSSYVMR